MAQPAIDHATFEELQQTAGVEFVRELVDTFLAEAPLMLGEPPTARWPGGTPANSAAPRIRSNPTATRSVRWRWARWRAIWNCPASNPCLPPTPQQLAALRLEYARVAAALTELAQCVRREAPAGGCWWPTTTRSTDCSSHATSSCRGTAWRPASNGREALEMLRRDRFDLVAARHRNARNSMDSRCSSR